MTSGFVDLPVGKGKRFLSNAGAFSNALLGGWQLGGIFTVETGTPTTPTDGIDVPNISTGATPRPDATGVSPALSNATPDRFFNPAAFKINAPFTFGNAGRNTVRGPGLVVLDMSVTKRIPFTERIGSELRWEVFNAPNHPIFGLPNTNLSSSAYTTISGTRVDSRQMQLALRILF